MKLDRFEPNRIVTSNLVSPKVLAAVRFVELLYVTAAIISVWATAPSAGEYFRYFTNLSYFGLFSYLLVSFFLCFFHCFVSIQATLLHFLLFYFGAPVSLSDGLESKVVKRLKGFSLSYPPMRSSALDQPPVCPLLRWARMRTSTCAKQPIGG